MVRVKVWLVFNVLDGLHPHGTFLITRVLKLDVTDHTPCCFDKNLQFLSNNSVRYGSLDTESVPLISATHVDGTIKVSILKAIFYRQLGKNKVK